MNQTEPPSGAASPKPSLKAGKTLRNAADR